MVRADLAGVEWSDPASWGDSTFNPRALPTSWAGRAKAVASLSPTKHPPQVRPGAAPGSNFKKAPTTPPKAPAKRNAGACVDDREKCVNRGFVPQARRIPEREFKARPAG